MVTEQLHFLGDQIFQLWLKFLSVFTIAGRAFIQTLMEQYQDALKESYRISFVSEIVLTTKTDALSPNLQYAKFHLNLTY